MAWVRGVTSALAMSDSEISPTLQSSITRISIARSTGHARPISAVTSQVTSGSATAKPSAWRFTPPFWKAISSIARNWNSITAVSSRWVFERISARFIFSSLLGDMGPPLQILIYRADAR